MPFYRTCTVKSDQKMANFLKGGSGGLQKIFLSPHVNCQLFNLSSRSRSLGNPHLPQSLLGARLPTFTEIPRENFTVQHLKQILRISKYFYLLALDPSFWLEKIYCYVPCKCAFYRLILSLNSNVFSPSDCQTFDNLNSTRPSPARPNY